MKLLYEKLRDGAHAPTKEFPEDAGWDLRAREHYSLKPGMFMVMPTGLAMKLQPSEDLQEFAQELGLSWYLRMADKSGLAVKKGIHILAGVVDRNFRGEVGIVVANLGILGPCGHYVFSDWNVSPGDKICQAVPEMIFDVREAEEAVLDSTDRGTGGFGHTGV